MFKFKGGNFVKDQLTNFSGIINGVILHDTGNIQYSIQPACADGETVKDALFIDGDFLEHQPENDLSTLVDFNETHFKFKNGNLIKSHKSSITGYIYGQVVWITGCISYQITSTNLNRDGNQIYDNLSENDCVLVKKLLTWSNWLNFPKISTPIKLTTSRKGGPSSISSSNKVTINQRSIKR